MIFGKVFIAVDLGAGSGRVIAAKTDFSRIELEEMHRFENPGIDLPTGCYWNILGLYREILEGIRRSIEKYGDQVVSIGIDTWACDYGLLDTRGELLGTPHQYRDPRFHGMAEAMHELITEEDIFARTGIKTNFYNSSLHLLSEVKSEAPGLFHAQTLLFVPDLFAYWLTGKIAVERTVASTSQLLDPITGDWARDVIAKLGLPDRIFGSIVSPGTVLGDLRPEVGDFVGKRGVPVVASASHDTAAAVAGIPMDGKGSLWLSSGTWSIMGVELDQPVTTPKALEYGFCNELGVAGTVRFLKNIGGLWLIQECKRQWDLDGEKLSYAELAELAHRATPFTAFIDPDDAAFAGAGDMPEKIKRWCEISGQPVPADKGTLLRIVTESLALKYRLVRDRAEELTGLKFRSLHAGGGGIQNEFLAQATANALEIDVIAGPVEATSCGNVITQMVGTGSLPDFETARELIRSSFTFKTYTPHDSPAWNDANLRFRKILNLM